MDFEQIEKLGNIPTPKLFDTVQAANLLSTLGSTVDINSFGDLLLVGEDGYVYYNNIRLTNSQNAEVAMDGTANRLQVAGIDAEGLKRFTSIVCNTEGNIIVLWSKFELGIIEIPPSFLKEGQILPNPPIVTEQTPEDENQCKFQLIYGRASSGSTSPIVKVGFHSINANTLVVLYERELLSLIDLRTFSKDEIFLPKHLNFTSFTFTSQSLEWFAFTLFLTTSTNEIYYLCPIIPSGTIISKAVLSDILVWIQEEQEKLDILLSNISSSKTIIEKKHLIIEEKKKFLKISLNYLFKKFSKFTIQEMLEKLKESPSYYRDHDPASNFYHHHNNNASSSLASAPSSSLRDFYVIADNSTVFSSSTSYSLENQLFPEKFDEEDHVQEKFMNSFRLSLQGPIAVLQPVNGKKEATTNNLSIHDICIPTIPLQSSGLIAPLIAVVQSNGNVDILLFDILDETQWMIAPAWKTVDNPQPLQYLPAPSLIVTDSVQVPATSDAHDAFQIFPDPVFSHYLYVVNKKQGEAYLVISTWLQETISSMTKVLEEITKSTTNDSQQQQYGTDKEKQNSSQAIKSNEKDNNFNQLENLKKSEFFPLYQSSESNEFAGINGLKILKDPFLGHLIIIHTDTQELVIVNITTHLKLCQLQNILHEDINIRDLKEMTTIQKQLDYYTSNEYLRNKKTQSFLLQIMEGLQSIPKLEIFLTKENKEIPKSEAQNKKELIETAQLLEKKVITPLKGLIQNLLFHLNLLQEMYLVQSDLINGQLFNDNNNNDEKSNQEKQEIIEQIITQNLSSKNPNANNQDHDNHNNSNKINKEDLLLQLGVNGMILLLQKENSLLNERIRILQENNERIKEDIDRYLNIIINTRKRLTTGEKLYKEQLEEWIKLIPKLSKDIENIKQTIQKQKLLQHQALHHHQQQQQSSGPGASKSFGLKAPGSLTAKPLPAGLSGFNVSKPSFFQANKASFHPLGSPLGSPPPATAAASNNNKPAGAAANKPQPPQFSSPPPAASLSFTTTLGSSSAGFFSNSKKPLTFGQPQQQQVETPVKGIPMDQLDADGAATSVLLSSEMKRTMTLNELAGSAEKKVLTPSHQQSAGGAGGLELSEKDQDLCFELLKSEEEMIQQAKKKLLVLEKTLSSMQKPF